MSPAMASNSSRVSRVVGKQKHWLFVFPDVGEACPGTESSVSRDVGVQMCTLAASDFCLSGSGSLPWLQVLLVGSREVGAQMPILAASASCLSRGG